MKKVVVLICLLVVVLLSSGCNTAQVSQTTTTTNPTLDLNLGTTTTMSGGSITTTTGGVTTTTTNNVYTSYLGVTLEATIAQVKGVLGNPIITTIESTSVFAGASEVLGYTYYYSLLQTYGVAFIEEGGIYKTVMIYNETNSGNVLGVSNGDIRSVALSLWGVPSVTSESFNGSNELWYYSNNIFGAISKSTNKVVAIGVIDYAKTIYSSFQ